jgi:hypothetical protein
MFTDARSIVAQELVRGERLLWYGQPVRGFRLRNVLTIVYATGFTAFWIYSALAAGAPPLFAFGCIPIFAFICYRFFSNAKRRASTFYGVTDQRLITISGSDDREVRSLPLAKMPEMVLSERTGGLGTLKFGNLAQFELIEDARVVYQIVRDAQKRKNESGRLGRREPVGIPG